MTYMEKYHQWLSTFKDDEIIVSELESIKDDDAQIEDRFYTELSFGTAGMRGVLGAGTNRMNTQSVKRATQGLANYLNKDPKSANSGVAIGYDSRRFSDTFALEAALVLCANGIKAYLFDELRPVALLSFAVRELEAAAGIVITASHNPKQYNGYKVYGSDGAQIPPEIADEVTSEIQNLSYNDNNAMDKNEAIDKGLLVYIGKEIDDIYMKNVHSICVNPKLCKEMGEIVTIVYTPLNGSGNKPVRRILSEVGFKNVHVVAEQELPDPEFTTVGVPNPENKSVYTLAMKKSNEINADVIIGTDPDCDRLGVALKKNKDEYIILSGNQIGALLMDYVCSNKQLTNTMPRNPAVIKSFVSTKFAQAIANNYNVTLFNVATGFKFIAEKIEEFENDDSYSYLFGFEESYGYLIGTFVRDKDAVSASMLLCECVSYYKKQGKTLYEGLISLYEKYGYYLDSLENIALTGKDGQQKMTTLMQNLREHPPTMIAGETVVKYSDFSSQIAYLSSGKQETLPFASNALFYELEDESWICIRPSGTEPKMKVYYNTHAASEYDATKNLENMAISMREILQELGL